MFDVLLIIIIIFWVMVLIGVTSGVVSDIRKKRFGVQADDGHRVPVDQDLTCETQHGHTHTLPEGIEEVPRYIVHEDPEEGYIILNGIKRRIKDCKDL